MIGVTVSEARDGLAHLLGTAQHAGEDKIVTKHGKPVAVMISVEAMAYYESLEDADLSRMVDKVYADPDYDPNKTIPHDKVWSERARSQGAE